jgi:hypothetical protein
MAQPSAFVSEARKVTKNFMEIVGELYGVKRKYDSLVGFDEDSSGSDWPLYTYFSEAGLDINHTDFVALMTSIEALETWMNTGHKTNFYKVTS